MKGSFTVRSHRRCTVTDRLSIIESLEKRAFRCRRSNNSPRRSICKIAEQSTTYEAEKRKKKKGKRESRERGNKAGNRYRARAKRKPGSHHNYSTRLDFIFLSVFLSSVVPFFSSLKKKIDISFRDFIFYSCIESNSTVIP